jgi:hypothetical protein
MEYDNEPAMMWMDSSYVQVDDSGRNYSVSESKNACIKPLVIDERFRRRPDRAHDEEPLCHCDQQS